MLHPNIEQALEQLTTVGGKSVRAMSEQQPVLLVFLRHFGCTFCREALSDLAARSAQIDAYGGRLVLVHMADTATSAEYLNRYGLAGTDQVSDPECRFYEAFGLTKGTARQLFGLHSWIRGFQAGVLDGHGVGTRPLGDGFQMPGVFVIQNSRIVGRFVHKLAGDRPDYVDLLTDCCRT